MIWPIFFIVSFFILVVFVWKFKKQKQFFFFDYVKVVMVAIIVSAALFGFGMDVGSFMGNYLPKHWEKTETIKLTMLYCYRCYDSYPFLVVNEGRNGGNVQYYHYKRDGLYVETLMAAGNAIVFESVRPDGLLEVSEKRFAKPWFRWIAFEQKNKEKKYEFFIPRGSNFVFE